MRKSIERLMELVNRRNLTDSEMNELLKVSLVLACWALEMNANCVANEQDRKEMVIMVLSLLTSRIFEALGMDQRNIVINPSDPADAVDGDTEYSHLVGNC